MKKLNQRERVIEKLLKEGYVSRNYYIDLPYDKILRLGAIIKVLRNEGWEIETKEDKRDCIYKTIKAPYKQIIWTLPDGRKVMTYAKN